MKSSEIHIIGAGLYGSLSAIKLKKRFPNKKINLIDSSDKVLSGFSPVRIEKYNINNGFHGIELPRAKKLHDFLIGETKLSFDIVKNVRKILINNHLVDYDTNYDSHPIELKKFYLNKTGFRTENVEDFFKFSSKEYFELLKLISQRYSSNFNNSKTLLAPWFFPSDYVLESNDEGDIYRNQVRSMTVEPFYGIPSSGLFIDLEEQLSKVLESYNIRFLRNTEVKIEKNSLSFKAPDKSYNLNNKSNDVIFFATSPIQIIRSLSEEVFIEMTRDYRYFHTGLIKCKVDKSPPQYFTEILCCIKDFPELARISRLHNHSNKDYEILQIELFSKISNSNDLLDNFEKNMIKIINNIGYQSAEIIDIKQTRKTFSLDSQLVKKANKVVESWKKNFKYIDVLKQFGPINMSKTWIYSDDNIDKYNTFMDKEK